MKHVQMLDKFPVYTLDILKTETTFKSADEVLEYLEIKVEAHPTGSIVAVFDHYGHVEAQKDSTIDPSILDCKSLIFCLANEIPNAMIGALRPRSIAINELENKFVVNFQEAPKEAATNVMKEWVTGIKNT
jgi:hypothetical protein